MMLNVTTQTLHNVILRAVQEHASVKSRTKMLVTASGRMEWIVPSEAGDSLSTNTFVAEVTVLS